MGRGPPSTPPIAPPLFAIGHHSFTFASPTMDMEKPTHSLSWVADGYGAVVTHFYYHTVLKSHA